MKQIPIQQKYLFGLEKQFSELTNLFEQKKLPNKILLSGKKGTGKCTLAFHLINFILSKDEDHPYDLKNLTINETTKTFQLISNRTHPNFSLIDLLDEKKKY